MSDGLDWINEKIANAEISLSNRAKDVLRAKEELDSATRYHEEGQDHLKMLMAIRDKIAPPTVSDREEGERPAREETKAFVRDILENTFGQQTTDEQVEDVAQQIDALAPPRAYFKDEAQPVVEAGPTPPPQEAPAIPEGGEQTEHDQPPLSQEAFEALPKFDDNTLIVDETPTVPRSEIPEGSAVETFTDAGVETVKLSGLTHIVTDEPAAFAPVNNTDQPATTEQLLAEGITEPGASELAAMRMAPEPKKFGGIFSFGAKKTLVGEGV